MNFCKYAPLALQGQKLSIVIETYLMKERFHILGNLLQGVLYKGNNS